MIEFTAVLEKFGKKGEKTGWTYITIPEKIAVKIKAGTRTSFRVKGRLDNFSIKAVALIPMGEGDFIMPINAAMRKGIKKQMKGEKVLVKLEEDKAPLELSADFLACLAEDKQAQTFFDTLGKSHQNYYSKWIESAKTEATKAKRIAQALNGFRMKMGYPEMLRYYREHKI
ncbi:MAG: YdeI/OmpD-associated family protein [Bacteroidia bacterium]